MIRLIKTKKEFIDIAIIHKSELNETGFISECSIRWIALFYRIMATLNSTILLVGLDNDDKIRGFIFCTTNKYKYQVVLKLLVLISAFFYPGIILPLLKKIIKKDKYKFIKYNTELTQIAVQKDFTGRHLGTQLIVEVEKELVNKNISEYYLQVFKANTAAISLYQKFGFKEIQCSSNKKLLLKKL